MRKAGNMAILVELPQPYNGCKRWLFGSKAAIFQHLPVELLGITLNYLRNGVKLTTEPHETRTGVLISEHELHRLQTNRGKYNRQTTSKV